MHIKKRGDLIVIEGTDGSGKATQASLLTGAIQNHKIPGNRPVRQVSFPRYGHPAAVPVESFLARKLSNDLDDVSPYEASLFYAIDRAASYRQEWRDFYTSGGIVVADRYTTSNAVHQGCRMPEAERAEYLRWLYDLEYDRLGLPRPTAVIYLDVEPEVVETRLRNRTGKPGVQNDILESDQEYQKTVLAVAQRTARDERWHVVRTCHENTNEPRSTAAIHADVLNVVRRVLTQRGEN